MTMNLVEGVFGGILVDFGGLTIEDVSKPGSGCVLHVPEVDGNGVLAGIDVDDGHSVVRK